MKNKNLSYYIKEFVIDYLPIKRNFSKNTIISYKDTLKLFLKFNIEVKNTSIKNINIEILTKDRVNEFLTYLKEIKRCNENTQNQRLACLKSFAKYILESDVTFFEQMQNIINIKSKKYRVKTIEIFTKEEIQDLLSKPNINSNKGLKHLVILILLYDAALRINELINFEVQDITFRDISKIKVKNAKGNKSREIPITKETANILKEYIKRLNIIDNDILIKSNLNKKYTSNGIRKIISKYAKDFRFKVTPHTFRHTKATHMVEASIPLIYIRDFLGHEHVDTTEIYAKINNNIKNRVITESSIDLNIPIKYDVEENEELLDFLKFL